MNEQQRKQLGRYYRSFNDFRKQATELIERKWAYMPEETFRQMNEEIHSALKELSDVLPVYDENRLRQDKYFRPDAVRAWLNRAIAAIEIELEQVPRGEVIGPTLSFPFVADAKIRAIAERDYPELLTAFSASCKKSCLILAGGLIEALLLDFVLRNVSAAQTSPKAPTKTKPEDWTLEQLIDVSVDLKPSLAPVQTMSHTVRKYRNLVHPSVEIKSNMKVEIEEARVAISVLQIVHRELSTP